MAQPLGRRLVFLLDAMHSTTIASLKQALCRFGNLLSVAQRADVHVCIAHVIRPAGANVQLQARQLTAAGR